MWRTTHPYNLAYLEQRSICKVNTYYKNNLDIVYRLSHSSTSGSVHIFLILRWVVYLTDSKVLVFDCTPSSIMKYFIIPIA